MVFPVRATARVAGVLVLCAGFFAASPAQSQSLSVDGDATLLLEGDWMQPRWSPDGTRLAVTAPRFEGIALVDAASGDVTELTDDAGAGYGFSWSSEGDAILARASRQEGRLRSHAVRLYDVSSGEARNLTEFRPHMATLPVWADGEANVALVSPGGDVERVTTGRMAVASKASVPVFAQAEDGIRLVTAGGRSELVRSFDEREVLNVTPSPDGRLVAFEIVGGNLMVMDARGSNVRDLGRGYRPSWSPDGEWVVFMVTEDDGYRFTASELVAARADASERVELTSTNDRVELNPSWSPDGRHIAFDDDASGAIYLLPVSY